MNEGEEGSLCSHTFSIEHVSVEGTYQCRPLALTPLLDPSGWQPTVFLSSFLEEEMREPFPNTCSPCRNAGTELTFGSCIGHFFTNL